MTTGNPVTQRHMLYFKSRRGELLSSRIKAILQAARLRPAARCARGAQPRGCHGAGPGGHCRNRRHSQPRPHCSGLHCSIPSRRCHRLPGLWPFSQLPGAHVHPTSTHVLQCVGGRTHIRLRMVLRHVGGRPSLLLLCNQQPRTPTAFVGCMHRRAALLIPCL